MICLIMLYYYCFFFKQKTAYEMRISDWSSDVCSSDLPARSSMTRAACGSTSHFPRRPDCAARPEATTGGRYRRPGVDATLHRDHACIMPTTTRMRIVEKPWGRIHVPVAFGDLAGRRIGEIWFEDTAGTDAQLLAKFIFTSHPLSFQVHPPT